MNGFRNALHSLNDVSAIGVEAAMEAGYAGSLLAIIVLAISLLGRRCLTASQMGFLWGLVLLRMVMPLAPASDASVHNLVTRLFSEPAAVVATTSGASWQSPWQHEPWTPDPSSTEVLAGAPPAEMETWSLIDLALTSVQLVWLAGLLFVLTATMITHWRFSRKVARSLRSEDERLLAIWQRCRDEVGVRRPIPIIECDEVAQPAVMGVLRPRLLLPTHCLDLDHSQLRMVMLHELMHVRCHDIAINWLLVLVRAIQWWNPFFWLANSRFINLREQSRDAMVLRHLTEWMAADVAQTGEAQAVDTKTDDTQPGDAERARPRASVTREYSELLLTLAALKPPRRWPMMAPASMLGFISGWFRERTIANRLRAISSATRKQHHWHRYGVIGLTLATGLIGLTDAAQPIEESVYTDSWNIVTASAGHPYTVHLVRTRFEELLFHNDFAGPWTERDYNITAAVDLIASRYHVQVEEVLRILKRELGDFVDPTTATRNQAPTTSNELMVPHTEIKQQGTEWIVHVAGPLAMHRHIERVVHAWNRSGIGQVSIETRIATTRSNVTERLGLSWDGILSSPQQQKVIKNDELAIFATTSNLSAGQSDGLNATAVAAVQEHVPMMLKRLSDEQVRQFMQLAQRDSRSNILFAPKVTLFNGQQGHIFSGAERPFVTGLNQGDDGTVEGRIEVVPVGISLTVRAELTEDHTATDIAAELDLSGIKDVQTFSTKMFGKEVAVQVPRVSHLRMNTAVRLEEGQTLLVCFPPTYEQKQYYYVLLTPRTMEEAPSPVATANEYYSSTSVRRAGHLRTQTFPEPRFRNALTSEQSSGMFSHF